MLVAYDEWPAQDDWPGGTRYGLTRTLGWKRREWSPMERALASLWGVSLPTAEQPYVFETWFDLQRTERIIVPSVQQTVMWTPDMDLVPTDMLETRIEVREPKRYGRGFWVGDPLANVRTLEP